MDRLTRSPRELEEVIDLHDQRGVQLATVTGEIDLSTPTGRMLARMLGAAARHEAEHKPSGSATPASRRPGPGSRTVEHHGEIMHEASWPAIITPGQSGQLRALLASRAGLPWPVPAGSCCRAS